MGNLHITNDAKGDVDFTLALDHNADNEKAKAFIKSHPYHYDLLVLNTCPFRFMPYDASRLRDLTTLPGVRLVIGAYNPWKFTTLAFFTKYGVRHGSNYFSWRY